VKQNLWQSAIKRQSKGDQKAKSGTKRAGDQKAARPQLG
jgi:hypothetical protein